MVAVHVGDKVVYDGAAGVVIGTGRGEYGFVATIKLESGAVVRTDPRLDHRWNEEKEAKVPTLYQLMWGKD